MVHREVCSSGVVHVRSRVPTFALTFTAIMLTIVFFPAGSEGAVTLDPYEVIPGTIIWLDLIDFDHKGDELTLTITFKGTSSEDYESRGIDLLILDKSRAEKTTKIEIAEPRAIWVKKNVSTRIEEKIRNPTDGKKSIVFYNPLQTGDEFDWDNSTVRIRIDYEVENSKEDEGLDILPILLASLIVVIILVLISMVVIYFKRRSKDARTFFNPESGPYYAFRSAIDGRIYYIDPDQYARLYESNSLGNYDFLGTATRIGGPITPPDGGPTEGAVSSPMGGKILTAVPIEGSIQQVDLASMDATPIAPDPLRTEELYGVVDPEEPSPDDDPSAAYSSEQFQAENSVDSPETGDPISTTGELTGEAPHSLEDDTTGV
jgi:hypothetical protein